MQEGELKPDPDQAGAIVELERLNRELANLYLFRSDQTLR